MFLKSQESIDTLTHSLKRNQQRLPFQIAQSYLQGNSQAPQATQQQIVIAQERLEWFEPHLPLVASVESFFANFPDSSSYQQQWCQAIDAIGDLTIPQAEIKTLAIHCDFLAAGWFVVEAAFLRIKELVAQGNESSVLEECFYSFQQHWEQLWQAFFDTSALQTTEESMKSSFRGCSQILQRLSEFDG